MINLIIGSMKSGKSAKLLETAYKLKSSLSKKEQDKVIFIRPSCDTRNFITRKVIDFNHKDILYGNEYTDLKDFDYIFIDEVQFFKKKYIQSLIANRKKKAGIFCAGLNADIKHKVWGNIATLIPFVSSIELLKANCDICGAKESAIYNIGDGKIGDNYKVVCPRCKIELN